MRFGHKVWFQNLFLGYLIAYDYQGKTYHSKEETESKSGKSASTVLHLASPYSNDKAPLPYHFYFDKLLTTHPLMQKTWRKRQSNLFRKTIEAMRKQGHNEGGRGTQFPERRITLGAAKNPENITSTFFNTVHLLPEHLRFEHGDAKLASYPGHHLTSSRPSK